MTMHKIDLIENMLEWQAFIDQDPGPLNEYGATRFWATVGHHMGVSIIRNGTPDCNQILFRLTPGDTPDVALELTPDMPTGFIRFRFVPWPDVE
jgi:hypothetical protein